MIFAPFLPEDVSRLPEIQPSDWNDIRPNFEFYTASPFCRPFKATDATGQILGIGSVIFHGDVAWLGHIVTHEAHRNRGIGGAVTRFLVERATAAGCETVWLVATEMGEPVYRKIGFEAETEYLFFNDLKMADGWVLPNEIVPLEAKFKAEILALDKAATGENRRVELEAHLAGGFVFWAKNAVRGFYLPTLGDGLVIADEGGAGLGLLKFRLQTAEKLSFPKDNLVAAEFMESLGVQPFRVAKRMFLGKYRRWFPEKLYSRIGGNVG